MKKFISIFLVALVILGLGISVFADDETYLREIAAKNVLTRFKNDEVLLYNAKEADVEKLTSVAYPTYRPADEQGRTTFVGLIYDGEECIDSYFMLYNGDTVFVESSAMGRNLEIGLSAFKEKFGVKDEDITLFYTMEGFYASLNGDTNRLYRVGDRYFDMDLNFVDESYSLSQLKKAEMAFREDGHRRLEAGELDMRMGGTPDKRITDFIKPEFPLWGYIAIAVGVVLVSLTVFSIIKRKKQSNG